MSSWRRWLAVGTGVGIEAAPAALRIVVVRVRPSGADVLDTLTIENYLDRPAAEWGGEYARLLRRHAASHVAAVVLLPRREVIARTLDFPGVAPADLEAALGFEIDSLHPFAEVEATWTWTRLGNSHSVLVAITRRLTVERHLERFREAGVKVAGFSFSAPVVYSALRLFGEPPQGGFLGLIETEAGIEAYGESPARPLFSSLYDPPDERAAALAAAQLRLPESAAVRDLAGMIPSPRRTPADAGLAPSHRMAYLAALASACPRLALPVNLLPPSERSTSSRWIYAPTAALAGLLALSLVAMAAHDRWLDQRYLRLIETEAARLAPQIRLAEEINRRIEQERERIALLDAFQTRTARDLEALREVTKAIAPPAWLNSFELTRNNLIVAGEAEQAAGLLKTLDSSPLFQNSEFLVPLNRSANIEVFRIRAQREGTP